MYRFYALTAAVLSSSLLEAQCLTPDPACVGPGTQCAALSWDATTLNTDGSNFTPGGYEVRAGCNVSGQYELGILDVGNVTACDYQGLPTSGTCFFQVLAYDDQGNKGAYSLQATKFMGPLLLAGPATDFSATAFESGSAPPPSGIVDFSNTVSYDGDQSQSYEVFIDGIQLNENTWRATVETFDVTANTVLTFDFEGISQGEIHGIGFDTDLTYSPNRFFRVWGTQPSSSVYNDFNTYNTGVESFSIPVGQFYTGSNMRLILINDHDRGTGSASVFRNVRIQ